MSVIANFSKQLALLLPAVGSADFPIKLTSLLKGMVNADNLVIVEYPDKYLPKVIHNDAPPEPRSSTIDLFLKGAFLLDPYYLAASENKSGFFHLRDLAPQGFEESEYCRIYYQATGLLDECGYLVQLGGREFANISLGRINVKQVFSKDELKLLADIGPVIDSLFKQYWLACRKPASVETDRNSSGLHQPDLRQPLETALECFGSSMLTDRETQMANLILRGYSTKAISSRLNISVETVKLHRKNAYAKLDIKTQGELFHLFIDSLICTENYEGGDPLIAYHQPNPG